MLYRTLGSTGMRISSLGFGGMAIGGSIWNEADDGAAVAALRAALERGITFFDTALAYGNGHSERLIGKATSGRRVVIATKVPRKNALATLEPHRKLKYEFPREHILKCARQSYENLGRRPIGLLHLHAWHEGWLESEEWLSTFAELRAEGTIRYFGVSVEDHAPQSALRLVESGKVDAIQVSYNIFDQSAAECLLRAASDTNTGVIVRCPLDKGTLTGTFTPQTRFADYRKHYFTQRRLQEVIPRVEALRWLETGRRSLPQAALQFCLGHPAVSAVIPGMSSPHHVRENVAALSGTLKPEELERLKAYRWERRYDLPLLLRAAFSLHSCLKGHGILR